MALKLDARAIAEGLGNYKRSGDGFMACCPAHEDNNPSLSIKDGSDNRVLVHCFAGCTQERVIDRLDALSLWHERKAISQSKAPTHEQKPNIAEDEIITPVPSQAGTPDWAKFSQGKPSSVYEYRDENGLLLMLVARFDKADGSKDFKPFIFARNQRGEQRWINRSLPEPRPLWGLLDLAKRADADVLLVEGEKTALAARDIFQGKVVMTWSAGAGSVAKADFTPLKERNVILWPDNDEAGRKAMRKLANMLKAIGAKRVLMVQVPVELGKGWDVADPVTHGVNLHELLANASEPKSSLRAHVLTADELKALEVPEREYIVTPFLPTSSLSMIYAERGLGKTWFAMSMCVAISHGNDFLSYEIPKERIVLYIDGEMALYDLKSRVVALDPEPNENLFLMPSERLFKHDRPLNVNDPDDQLRIENVIQDLIDEGRGPDLVVFDNLSSLSAGTDENDNSALDALLTWLVSLRHRQLAILLVHHAGKSGDQRGASRSEDLLDTSIKLSKPKKKKGEEGDDEEEPHDGAHFIVEFVKTRGIRPNPYELELRLTQQDGIMVWDANTGTDATASDKVLRDIGLKSPRSQAELCEMTRRKKSSVSQHCTKLRDKGFIDGKLDLTHEGRQHLVDIWPDLDTQLMRQEEIPI
jgi:hypothetical protein